MTSAIQALEQQVVALERQLMPLYGPRGGLARQYRALEFQYYKLLGDLLTVKAYTPTLPRW